MHQYCTETEEVATTFDENHRKHMHCRNGTVINNFNNLQELYKRYSRNSGAITKLTIDASFL